MKRSALFLIFIFCFIILFFGNNASAAVSITTSATSNISSDSYSGASISVPNIVITEGAVDEIDKVTAHVWTVPAGYEFDTSAAAPSVTYTNGLAGPATASMTATTMTIDTTATSTPAGVMTIGSTASIKVKVTTGCPLASPGNLTHTAGTITGITNSVTSFGTWTQVQGSTVRCGGSRRDTVPPTTSIKSPVDNQKIEAVKSYTVTGTSADTGGSSMQKVEISFNGGISWDLVKPTTPALNNGFNWEYEWLNPQAGAYNIKTRGTDWGDSLEEPGAGITVLVETPVIPKEKVIEKIEEAPAPAPSEKAVEPATEASEVVMPISQPEVASTKLKPSVMLIRAQGDPRVYVIHNNIKKHIPSADVFNSYGYSWQDVQEVLSEVASGYKMANLIKKIGDHKVYAIENGKKRWIKTAEEFVNAGYNWEDIMEVSQTEFGFYPEKEITKNVIINTDVLNIRNSSSLTGGIVGKAYLNNVYEVVAEEGEWLKIKLPGNKEGWVFAEYTE